MNKFMSSCNLYRNWQSILTLICCTLFYLDSNNLSLLPMSLFLDNCVLCFQCTSLKDFVNFRDKKNAIWSCQIHSHDLARDQNPLHLLPPCLFSVCQSPSLPKLASARRRAEWEYKSTTLLYSHQMVFLFSSRKYVLSHRICKFEERRTYF